LLLHTTRAIARQTLTITLIVVFLDVASKTLAASVAARGYANGVLFPMSNPDFSLGLASAAFPLMLVLSSLGILSFGTYTIWAAARGNVLTWVPGFLIGGALANLGDRVVFGAVHDWLHVATVVINLADIAVVVGLLGYAASFSPTRTRSPLPLHTGPFPRTWFRRALAAQH
jgi:lipoprotein signal peptidase